MRRPRVRRRTEGGAVAVLFAILALLLLMMSAFAVDLTMQVNRKHYLQDTLDAAAQAGAFDLPSDTATARTSALTFAAAHDATATGANAPFVDFWCVVASTSGAVDTTQIPSTCYPGAAPYTISKYAGLVCGPLLCAIPCVQPVPNNGTPAVSCNTIRVTSKRDVPFSFAPAGGINQGSTGAVISVACRGACGTVAPNPMDVAIVADRTPSMSTPDLQAMQAGIKSMLQVMEPSQQYVTLGTINRSSTTTRSTASCNSTGKGLTWPTSNPSVGQFMPMAFYKDYLTGTALNTSSKLVQGLNCLDDQRDNVSGTALASPMKAAARYLLGMDPNNLGSLPERNPTPKKVIIFETDGQPWEVPSTGGSTNLEDTSNGGDVFSNVNSKVTNGPVTTTSTSTSSSTQNRQVGWFSTYKDTYNYTTTTTTKTTTTSYTGGQNACANLASVAQKARAKGILIITIAYNLSRQAQCGDNNNNGSGPPNDSSNTTTTDTITNITPSSCRSTSWGGQLTLNTGCTQNATITVDRDVTNTVTAYDQAPDSRVLDVLAGAASPNADNVPSAANNGCSTDSERATENADGDYFFCAASGSDMASIFTTALSQVSTGIKLIRMPGS
jgi:hypothetical protein